MFGLRIIGFALVVVGVVAAAFPRWFGPLTGGPEPPAAIWLWRSGGSTL